MKVNETGLIVPNDYNQFQQALDEARAALELLLPAYGELSSLYMTIVKVQTAVRGYGNEALRIALRTATKELGGQLIDTMLIWRAIGKSLAQIDPKIVVYTQALIDAIDQFNRTGNRQPLRKLCDHNLDPLNRLFTDVEPSGMSGEDVIGKWLATYEGVTTRQQAAAGLLDDLNQRKKDGHILSAGEIEASRLLAADLKSKPATVRQRLQRYHDRYQAKQHE